MTELKLYVPLLTPSSRGSLLVRYDFVKSVYSYRNETKNEAELYSKDRSVSALGLVYQTPIEKGRPSYLVLASRYGAGPNLSASQPMGEYIAAVRWDHAAIPWFSLPSDAVERRLTLLVRYRNFPNRQTWLGLVGLNFESQDGLRLEAHIPSHIQFGIRTMDRNWYLYSEARLRPILNLTNDADTRLWADGYSTQLNLGVRRLIYGMLYVTFEAGIQKENSEFYSSEGKLQSYSESDFSPWAKLAIETFVDLDKDNTNN